LSKSKAETLIKGLRWAVTLSRDTAQLTVAHAWSVIKAALRPILPKPHSPVRPSYIPETLPSPEVPGVIFKEPVSAIWRKDPASQSLAVRFLPIEEVFAARHLAGI
jgi:hypothetical protein